MSLSCSHCQNAHFDVGFIDTSHGVSVKLSHQNTGNQQSQLYLCISSQICLKGICNLCSMLQPLSLDAQSVSQNRGSQSKAKQIPSNALPARHSWETSRKFHSVSERPSVCESTCWQGALSEPPGLA